MSVRSWAGVAVPGLGGPLVGPADPHRVRVQNNGSPRVPLTGALYPGPPHGGRFPGSPHPFWEGRLSSYRHVILQMVKLRKEKRNEGNVETLTQPVMVGPEFVSRPGHRVPGSVFRPRLYTSLAGSEESETSHSHTEPGTFHACLPGRTIFVSNLRLRNGIWLSDSFQGYSYGCIAITPGQASPLLPVRSSVQAPEARCIEMPKLRIGQETWLKGGCADKDLEVSVGLKPSKRQWCNATA